MTSGFNNQILVNKVQETLDMIKNVLPEENLNAMYANLIKAIDQAKGSDADIRAEPEGLHFIDSGEVLIIGKSTAPNARLSKCDSFGMCEVLRKTVSKNGCFLIRYFCSRVRNIWVMLELVYVKFIHSSLHMTSLKGACRSLRKLN
jgi:hypothetical protein